jgi:aspartyl/glutamyl-tRNA(Asn/Gln) amidotransferase C subunit
MATREEVKKLAALVRIEIDPADLEAFTKDFDAILAYVGQLEKLDLPLDAAAEKPALRNVMRIEGEPHEGGKYTEALASQFPAREGDALSVKQIITHE